MATSGIRVGAWNFLKRKHVIPVYREGKIVCAILIVYDGDPEEYPTLITKEAYDELQKWMELREIGGEILTDESPLMRDLWDLDKDNDARIGKPLTEEGIASLIRRALKKQGLRGKLEDGKHRHNFKMNHGLRKWHDTALRMVREPYQIRNEDINILTGHKSKDTIDNYYRPYADGENKLDGHLINEYLRAEEFLTIDPRSKKLDKMKEDIAREIEGRYEEKNKISEQRYILISFQREIERVENKSYILALEAIGKSGGELRKIEWDKDEQLEHFIDKQRKMGEELTEDQINYIKNYLAKNESVELYKVEIEKERAQLEDQDKHRFEEKYKQMSPKQQEKFKEKFPQFKGKSDEEITQELRRLGEGYTKRVNEIEKQLLVQYVEEDLRKDKGKRKEG
jgi:hypothetical protein